MGLDQSFYANKPQLNENGNFNWEQAKEVLYFRKFHLLHSEIQFILGEKLENGKTYRLNKADLEKLVKYIANNVNDYWAWEDNENFYHALGVLTYYIMIDEPLYYNGDW